MVPSRAQKVSQIEAPRPSSATAPSIWYDAVDTPHRKSVGNTGPPNVKVVRTVLDQAGGPEASLVEAAGPSGQAAARGRRSLVGGGRSWEAAARGRRPGLRG